MNKEAKALQEELQKTKAQVQDLLTHIEFLERRIAVELDSNIPHGPGHIRKIMRMICSYYKITMQELLSNKRSRSIAWPRQMAMALSYEFTGASNAQIGRQFLRDHTTVICARGAIKDRCLAVSGINKDYQYLKSLCETEFVC